MPRREILVVGLILLTLTTFWRVNLNGFVGYDDPDYITSNEIIKQGLSKETLEWAFGNVHGENTYWHPLTWVSHMIDIELFGMNAAGHHLMSLAFHMASAVVLFLLLQSMTGALWRSAMVAALFAIHPLQVESVAWATERKNVLSTLFWMLTLYFYGRYVKAPNATRYLCSLISFALGLMCKPALVPLPFVLLLLDYWPLRRFVPFLKLKTCESACAAAVPAPVSNRQIILEKLPFFVLAIASSLLTLAGHQSLGMLGEQATPPPLLKWGNVVLSYVRYLGKALFPNDLAVFYPFPRSIEPDAIVACIVLLFAISAVALWQFQRRPYIAVGWFWFLGVLTPTIGIVYVGIQAMADRFVYVPVVGLFIALVWGVGEAFQRLKVPMTVAWITALAVLGTLVSTSMAQVGYWKNDYTLFERARTVTRDNYMAYTAVGGILLREGKIDEAMDYFRTAQQFQPGFADTYYSIGIAMFKRNDMPAAITNFEQALKLRPIYPEARLNLALALQSTERLDESVENYQLYLRARPESADAHLGIGNALLTGGRFKEAIEHFREAIRLNPKASGAMARLAWILATHADDKIRNGTEALRLAQEACRLTNYQHVQTVNTLAAAYAESGDFDSAVKTAQQALDLAKSQGESRLVAVIENLRQRYVRREAYRE